MTTALTILALSFLPGQTEAELTKKLAPKYGVTPDKIDVRLWDLTRVDMLTDTYAIEVDFARKWAEAIGQSSYYALVTGKKPAIILLVRKGEDRFAYRCQTVCAKYGIKLFVERLPLKLEKKNAALGHHNTPRFSSDQWFRSSPAQQRIRQEPGHCGRGFIRPRRIRRNLPQPRFRSKHRLQIRRAKHFAPCW